MRWLLLTFARFYRAFERALSRKWSFLALFAVVFVGSVSLLATYDLLPEAKKEPTPAPIVAHSPAVAPAPVAEFPTRVVVPAIALEAPILNPATTTIAILDQALLSGAVRYPTSARLNEEGNVILSGHSSYLPIVRNPAYKTFNDIQKLRAGDTIEVYSATTRYTYVVRTVATENATLATIPLRVEGRVLTLSTCDSFGTKADRFVVTADFVDSQSIVK